MAESREWCYRGSSGNLVARTWLAPDAHPTHVVLIAHGYGEHVGRYEHLADALVRNGAVVYGVDHVGHGKSDGERVLILDFEEVVSDFHLLDERARREHPGLPVVLLGHSMGGLVAARYAQRYGQALRAVILSSPLIGKSEPVSAMLALQEIPNVPLDPSALSRDPTVGEAFAADPLVWHAGFKRQTLEATQRAVEAIAAGPPVGNLPLLWIHGTDDRLVPVERSREAINHLRGGGFHERMYLARATNCSTN